MRKSLRGPDFRSFWDPALDSINNKAIWKFSVGDRVWVQGVPWGDNDASNGEPFSLIPIKRCSKTTMVLVDPDQKMLQNDNGSCGSRSKRVPHLKHPLEGISRAHYPFGASTSPHTTPGDQTRSPTENFEFALFLIRSKGGSQKDRESRPVRVFLNSHSLTFSIKIL